MKEFTISENTSLEEIILKIKILKNRHVFVANANGSVIGIISEGDILECILAKGGSTIKASDIMTQNFKFVLEDSPEKDKQLINLFKQGYYVIPLLNEQRQLQSVMEAKDFI